jgi:hypothetical protein
VSAPHPKPSICLPYHRATDLEGAVAAIFDHSEIGCSFELGVEDSHSTERNEYG